MSSNSHVVAGLLESFWSAEEAANGSQRFGSFLQYAPRVPLVLATKQGTGQES